MKINIYKCLNNTYLEYKNKTDKDMEDIHTNFTYQIVDKFVDEYGQKYIIQLTGTKFIYTFHEKQLIKLFYFNYAHTGHSIQGDTIKEGFTIAQMDDNKTTQKWRWVSYTRPKYLDNLTILKVNDLDIDINYDMAISKIRGYKEQDKKANRTYDENDFVDYKTIVTLYQKQRACCAHCGGYISLLHDTSREVYTVNRKDNALAHIKENINLMHNSCNAHVK